MGWLVQYDTLLDAGYIFRKAVPGKVLAPRRIGQHSSSAGPEKPKPPEAGVVNGSWVAPIEIGTHTPAAGI